MFRYFHLIGMHMNIEYSLYNQNMRFSHSLTYFPKTHELATPPPQFKWFYNIWHNCFKFSRISLPLYVCIRSKFLQNWPDIQKLLYKQKTDSIITRISDYTGDVDHDNVIKAKKVLSKISYKSVRNASAGAAVFYQWVSILENIFKFLISTSSHLTLYFLFQTQSIIKEVEGGTFVPKSS